MNRFARNTNRWKAHVYDGVSPTYRCKANAIRPVQIDPTKDLLAGTVCWLCVVSAIEAGELVFRAGA